MRDIKRIPEDLRTCFFNVPLATDAADAIEELLADRDKALKKLCEWCGVCSEENRKALECDDIAMLDAPRWISVEDELPETGKVVLLCVNCEEAQPHTGFLTADGWFMHDVLEDMRRSKWKVTHWMPLPEPPKGVE